MRQHPERPEAALSGALQPGQVTAQAPRNCPAALTARPATLTARPATLTARPATLTARPATLTARFALLMSGTWAGQAVAQALRHYSRSVGRGSLRTLPPPILKTITGRLAP